MRKIGILFLLILFASFTRYQTTRTHNFSGTSVCRTRDEWGCNCMGQGNDTAKCKVGLLADVKKYILYHWFIQHLDLSNNNIPDVSSGVFSAFPNVIYLSLASCGIDTIRQEAFRGLTGLQELDLSDNNIQYWDTSFLSRNLPTLFVLNIAQNNQWTPDEQVLAMRSLHTIRAILSGVSYLKNVLVNCCLEKNVSFHVRNEKAVDPRYSIPGLYLCIEPKVTIKNASLRETATRLGYSMRCNILVKTTPEIDVTLRKHTTIDNTWYEVFLDSPCWKMVNTIHGLTLCVGLLALVFNLIVVVTTLRSRALRQSVAHVLVANVAVGDLLVAFYVTVIVITRWSVPSAVDYYILLLPYFCRIIGSCFLAGQFSSALMSFVMTLERYLAVVYCMRPHVRITMTTCQVAMATVWCLSVSSAVSFMTWPKFSARVDDNCVPGRNDDGVDVVAFVAMIGILLYATSTTLYCHIYLDVRRTSEKTEQLQTESKLARRIALVVFTNIIFFIVPMIVTSIVSISSLSKRISPTEKDIFYRTVAVTCFGTNCCLNPILFSFRNEKFRFEFFKLCFHSSNSVAPQT